MDTEMPPQKTQFPATLTWAAVGAGLVHTAVAYALPAYEVTTAVTLHTLLVLAVVYFAFQMQTNWQRVAAFTAILGCIAALIVALFRLANYFDLVYVFNMFTEPVRYAVLDAFTAALLYQLLLYIKIRFSH